MIRISVVLPTYNRLVRLRQVLEKLTQQTYPLENFEVIVVSDGSTDGTHIYLSELNIPLNLIPIFQLNQGPSTARNTGIQHARGTIILFLDDDVIPSSQLLAEHSRIHTSEGGNVVVLGPMLTPSEFQMSSWVKWEQTMLEKQYVAMQNGTWEPTARQFFTGNTSLARHHLLQHGGFDTRFTRAEDVELAYRLADSGLRFIFNPAAIGYHFADRSYTAWKNIPYAYGVNDVIFATQKKQYWLLPTIRREFNSRNPFIRILTYLCLDRPRITAIVFRLLQPLNQMELGKLSQIACSGVFNLQYYRGISSALGGRKVFLSNFWEKNP